MATATSQSKLVRVAGGELTVQNIIMSGAVADHFTITKSLFADIDGDCPADLDQEADSGRAADDDLDEDRVADRSRLR